MALIDKETIRAEIERRRKQIMEQDSPIAREDMGAYTAFVLILAFIDTLPEQPVEGLEEEIDFENAFDKYTRPIFAHDIEDEPFTQLYNCAKHFYELSKQSRPKISDNSLEEEINKYFEPIHTADIQFEPFTQMAKCARHFAEWGAEHAKK